MKVLKNFWSEGEGGEGELDNRIEDYAPQSDLLLTFDLIGVIGFLVSPIRTRCNKPERNRILFKNVAI